MQDLAALYGVEAPAKARPRLEWKCLDDIDRKAMKQRRKGPAIWAIDKLQKVMHVAGRTLVMYDQGERGKINRLQGVLNRAPCDVWRGSSACMNTAWELLQAAYDGTVTPDALADARAAGTAARMT